MFYMHGPNLHAPDESSNLLWRTCNWQFKDMSVWFHVDWSSNVQTPVQKLESKHRLLYLEMVPNKTYTGTVFIFKLPAPNTKSLHVLSAFRLILKKTSQMDEVFFSVTGGWIFFYSKITILPPNFEVGWNLFLRCLQQRRFFFFFFFFFIVLRLMKFFFFFSLNSGWRFFFSPKKTSMPPWISNGAPLIRTLLDKCKYE